MRAAANVPTADRLALAVEIEDGLRQLIEPAQVVELRALGVHLPGEQPASVLRGYFRDPADLARCAVDLDGFAKGIYFTLNPLRPDIMGRCPNRVERAGPGDAAKDEDVLGRRWLKLDFDPVRPSKTNSTDDELFDAIRCAERVWLAMRRQGWPEPRAGISGNGIHLLYRVDLPTDDGGIEARTLHRISREHSTPTVKIDPAVSNAARIWRLYGTLACKAPDTPERPRRRSVLLGRTRWQSP